MIFDLTERYPRGPKGRLKPEDYAGCRVDADVSPAVGGKWGWPAEEVLNLVAKADCESRWREILWNIKVNKEFADHDEWDHTRPLLFKYGRQLSRRSKRIWERSFKLKRASESLTDKMLYLFKSNYYSQSGGIAVMAGSKEEAVQQFEMFINPGLDALQKSKVRLAIRTTDTHMVPQLAGAAKGAYQIMETNDKYVEHLEMKQAELKEQIDAAQAAIEAMEDLKSLVNMYTINTVASDS